VGNLLIEKGNIYVTLKKVGGKDTTEKSFSDILVNGLNKTINL